MNVALKATSILVLLALLSGCAVSGANFVAPDPTPPGKGVVYFYRPWELQGAAIGLAVSDNGSPAVNVRAGQFIRYVTEPGHHTFTITDTIAGVKSAEFVVEPNDTYYVRSGIRSGVMLNTLYLTRVYPEEAIPELKDCCKTGE